VLFFLFFVCYSFHAPFSGVALAALHFAHRLCMRMSQDQEPKWSEVSEWVNRNWWQPGKWKGCGTGSGSGTGQGHGHGQDADTNAFNADAASFMCTIGMPHSGRHINPTRCPFDWNVAWHWGKRRGTSKQLKCRLVGIRFFRAHCTRKCCTNQANQRNELPIPK